MRNLLNISKLTITAALLTAAFVFAGCFQDPMSGSSQPRPAGKEDVQLRLEMAVSGVDNLAKGNVIALKKLVITLTSNATPADTVRDTILAGTQGMVTNATSDQTINKNYTLKSLRTWKVVAIVRDARDSLIHQDSATTPTLYSADTAAVSLNLSSRYAMYEAQFKTIPDSINSASGTLKQKLNLKRLVLKIDGDIVVDSTIPVGFFPAGATHALNYDYVLTSARTVLNSGTQQHLNSVYNLSANTAIVVGNGGWARRTVDGGSSWGTMTFNVSPGSKILRSVNFLNATTGWIAGDTVIYRTTNGGLNWTAQTSFSSTVGLRFTSVHFANASTGVATSLTGQIYRSTDGGATWTLLMALSALNGVDFAPSDTVGWAVGAVNSSFHIRKTTNSGSSWTNQTATGLAGTDTLRAVYAVNRDLAFTVGTGGKILRTTNGGTNWVQMTNASTQRLSSVWFLDAASGFAVGDNGTILSTNDSGSTWNAGTPPVSQRLLGINFFGGQAMAVGENGTVFSLAGPRLVEMLAYGPMGNWNTALPLFSGSKYVHAIAGASPTVQLTLNWVGPTTGTGSISATLGRVGKVTIIGNLPGTTFP